jgi:hypothetical protein
MPRWTGCLDDTAVVDVKVYGIVEVEVKSRVE